MCSNAYGDATVDAEVFEFTQNIKNLRTKQLFFKEKKSSLFINVWVRYFFYFTIEKPFKKLWKLVFILPGMLFSLSRYSVYYKFPLACTTL